MKTSIKTITALLLVSTTANALSAPVIVTSSDLIVFEASRRTIGLKERLLRNGILVQTNKKDFYAFNDEKILDLSDRNLISIMADLINWLTNGSVQLDQKNWRKMTPTTQDYGT